jgi:D-alanyl-lipoteichoic acid acyltransferase DltB (MBOAT superfamily)
MAIGVGKILGFELTENFHRPYFAVSVTDFWHRWHISLSTWLKD